MKENVTDVCKAAGVTGSRRKVRADDIIYRNLRTYVPAYCTLSQPGKNKTNKTTTPTVRNHSTMLLGKPKYCGEWRQIS